jgi:hypothetical protein
MAELDLRSLAVMRIAAGLLLAYDLIWRLRDVDTWLTDFGFLPRELVVEHYWNPAWWCLHLYSGATAETVALLLAHLAAALALAFGWYSRVASVVCWMLTLSLHNRAPLVLDMGDRLLLLLLMWGMLLPWGTRLSLDARRAPEGGVGGDRQTLWGGAGYLLQVVILYGLAGFWKLDPVWLTERSALCRVFQMEALTKPAGYWLMGHPGLMEAASVGTVALELLGPLLILAGNNRWRLVAVILFALFHAGIGLTMDLEMFPLVSLVVLIGLVPSCAWPAASEGPLPPSADWATRATAKSLAAAAILLTLAWNGMLVLHQRSMAWTNGPARGLAQTAAAFRVIQVWDLFAPVPRPIDSRYVVEAKLADGTTVDLLRDGAAYPTKRPALPYTEFADQRQRNYLSSLEYSVGYPVQARFLRRLAVLWDESHPQRKVLWMRLIAERTLLAADPRQRTRQDVQLAWALPKDPIWQGPVDSLPQAASPLARPIHEPEESAQP